MLNEFKETFAVTEMRTFKQVEGGGLILLCGNLY